MNTDRKRELENFYRREKRLPSYAEMMKVLGYRSKGGVSKFVERMIDEGVLGRTNGKLYPQNLSTKLRQLGNIRAGFPSMGEEVMSESLSLDEWIVRDPHASYILKVDGDSMIDAGICEGDYVVVEMTKDFRPGMIVVAEIDGEWTLKYLRTKNGKQYLEAANESYPAMYPKQELELHARVVGLVRKYD